MDYRQRFFIGVLMTCSLLMVNTAKSSALFDDNNANFWLWNETTGQVNSYRLPDFSWLENFIQNSQPVYSLRIGQSGLVNQLAQSSSPLLPNAQGVSLPTISLAGLGAADFSNAADTATADFRITPETGTFTETIKVTIAIDEALISGHDSLLIDWVTGTRSKVKELTRDDFNSRGIAEVNLYLAENQTHNVEVELSSVNDGAVNVLSTKNITYIINKTVDQLREDTDADGIPDLVEIAVGLDPTKNDWTQDSNGDGWSDFDVWVRESFPSYVIDGVPIDTDGDGWSDFDEKFLRNTNANDLVTSLPADFQLVSGISITPGSEAEHIQLRRFQSVPTAGELYEVEYLLDTSVVEFTLPTNNERLTGQVRTINGEVLFNSDNLLSVEEISLLTNEQQAQIPNQNRISSYQQQMSFNFLPNLRMPAGESAIFDIRERNTQIMPALPDGTPVTISRIYDFKSWIIKKNNISPNDFDNEQWTTASEWRIAFIAFLSEQLVQDHAITVSAQTTHPISILELMVRQEMDVLGGNNRFSFYAESNLILTKNIQQVLEQNFQRSFDDVIADIKTSENNILNGLFVAANNALASVGVNQLYSTHVQSEMLDVITNASDLAYQMRLHWLPGFATEIDNDVSLLARNENSDADTLSNSIEIFQPFSRITLPWDMDTDNDLFADHEDPCPLDATNRCNPPTPILIVDSSLNATESTIDEDSYLVLTVHLNEPATELVSVDYSIESLISDTAIAGLDYSAMSGTLIFEPGQQVAVIQIPLLYDTNFEIDETLHLLLTNAVGADLFADSYQLIINNVVPGELSNDASITNISLSSGSLNPVFDNAVTNYSVEVSFLIDAISITTSLTDENASLSINGESVASGVASTPINLSEGVNVISLVSTAENAAASQTVTFTVTREIASVFAQEAYIKASNTDLGDFFGIAVAIDANTLVVGAFNEDSSSQGVNGNEASNSLENSGAVYVFVRTDESNGQVSWAQQAYIKPSRLDSGQRFGNSVAIDNNTLVVGAYFADNSNGIFSGGVYVYTRNGESWTQQQYLSVDFANRNTSDNFGYSVDISGDRLVVGANREDSNASGVNGLGSNNSLTDSGAAYVYVRSADAWTLQAYLKASNPGSGDFFGRRVAIDNDTVVISAVAEESSAIGVNGDQTNNGAFDAGAVYVFTVSGETWTQQAYIKASNFLYASRFGESLAIEQDTLVVGASGERNNSTGVNNYQPGQFAVQSGAAYVLTRNAGVWSHHSYLKASNTDAYDSFGSDVAIFGNTIVVSARLEDGGVSGVNGAEDSNAVTDSGAVYVFNFDGLNWAQTHYVKSSNMNEHDSLSVVALGDGFLATGSNREWSSARGINGEQSNNDAGNSGAVYVFSYDTYLPVTTLSNLSLSLGTLSPAFNEDVIDYTSNVPYSVESISITPNLSDINASISVNGESIVAGGSASPITLAEGENTITLEVIGSDGIATNTIVITVTRQSATEFAQSAYLKASNTDIGDQFGYAMAVDGNTLVVSANREQSAAQGIDGDQTDNLQSDSGAVYVFTRNFVNDDWLWIQQAYLKASNTQNFDSFGSSVAIDGDTIVVGAEREDSNANGINGDQSNDDLSSAGAAYVFTRTAGVWTQQAYLKASNTGAGDRFGNSVSISGNQLAVAAYREDNSNSGIGSDGSDDNASNAGAVYMFERIANNWSQQAYIKASNSGASDQFGYRVSLHNGTLVVSADRESSAAQGINGDQADDSLENAGAVYVYTVEATNWTQQAYIKASNTDIGGYFGVAIDIEGDTLIVGANGEGSASTGVNGVQTYIENNNSGAAYVFTRSAGVWSQSAYLKASNTDMDDGFGSYVSINGNRIAVGASGEDSDASGVNGAQENSTTKHTSGAVYLFENNNGWAQRAYIKAANSSSFDDFSNVVLGDGFVAVSAPQEDSNASGINGNDTNESAIESGAIYIFSGDVIN